MVRAPRVAALCRFERIGPKDSSKSGQPEWTPLAQDLIGACPDRVSVLRQFTARFKPMDRRGSQAAAIVERRRALLVEFFSDPDPAVAAWARESSAELLQETDALREWERSIERKQQRFE